MVRGCLLLLLNGRVRSVLILSARNGVAIDVLTYDYRIVVLFKGLFFLVIFGS